MAIAPQRLAIGLRRFFTTDDRHPYDDVTIVAGQATLGLELLERRLRGLAVLRLVDQGPAAQKIEGQWRWRDAPIPVHSIDKPSMTAFLAAKEWPRVEWLTHRAAAHAQIVHDLLRREPGSTPSLKGLVVAGTGAGTINRAWQNALADAQSEGIWVWLSSRCVWGQALPQADQSVGERTPWPPAKACIAMALAWMASQEKAQL